MWNAEIATSWQGNGTDEVPFAPILGALLTQEGEGWEDVTAQPSANLTPDPNVYIVRVRCEAETLDAIESDSRFLVLWSELIKEEPEDAI